MRDRNINRIIVGFSVVMGILLTVGLVYGDAHPNTVVTFCEWLEGDKFADCIKTEYWHNDNYEVIKEITTEFRRAI